MDLDRLPGIQLLDLEPNSRFTFQQDSNRPKEVYWFKNMDGMYGQIFQTEKDMKAFRNPAFISGNTIVEPINEETSK